MSITKKELEAAAVFYKTVDTQWVKRRIPYLIVEGDHYTDVIQQKWTNELGGEEWRDIPLVMSD